MRLLDLEYRNFNSYGNAIQKIDLRNPNFYLLYGASGVGKSTIREVIGYLLYGKVDGKSMGDLPNRINKKGLWGRLTLEAEGSIIEIERGIKPSIFKVVIDGIDEDTAGKRNVQAILESEYYKMPQSTFNNVITISIDKFKSFLKMSPKDKRTILDQIFSFVMLNKVYEKLNRQVLDYAKDLNNLNGKIDVLTNNKVNIMEKIEVIENTNKDSIKEKLEDLEPKIKALKEQSEKIEVAMKTLTEKQGTINLKDRKIRDEYTKISHQIAAAAEKLSLYDANKCPTCSGDLTSDYHQERIAALKDEKMTLEGLKKEKQLQLQKVSDVLSKANEKQTQLRNTLNDIRSSLVSLVTEYKTVKASGEKDSSEFKDILTDTIKNIDTMMKELDTLKKDEYLYAEISKIFAEDGIKKQVLDSILPTLNQSINEFTSKLNFPYTVEIDNKFNSVLTSLGKEISVKTLSTGEHKKADFAVLIAIIGIMKRNFPGINLLFLDELLGNIDGHGIYEILSLTRKIVDDLGMNVFVINHSELPAEIFDYKIEVKKVSGFSEMHIEKT